MVAIQPRGRGGAMTLSATLTVVVTVLSTSSVLGFAPIQKCAFARSPSLTVSGPASSSTELFMGLNRKARRQQQKEDGMISKKKLLEAIDESEGGGKKKKKRIGEEGELATLESEQEEKKSALEEELEGKRVSSELGGEGESVVSGASIASAVIEGEGNQPEVSEVITDEDTGILRVVQGKNVRDIITGQAVKLSDLGPEYRMAQMFPGVPPPIREKFRLDWTKVTVPVMIQKLREASQIAIKDEATGKTVTRIPPHPSVSNDALDFVLANRDYLGIRMEKTLGRLKLRTQSQFKKEEALEYRALWKNFLTVERHLTAPFRQMMLDAEKRVGPNFGNLDLASFCDGELYERTACYLVLKSMVAHWQKKTSDAEYVESTPDTGDNTLEILMVGDPKRYLPDPPIIFRLDECQRISQAAANMTAIFSLTPELYDDLPPEVRFVEEALRINTGTEMRRFAAEVFCPAEGITTEGLREGIRRLAIQLDSMQIDPYGDLRNAVVRLSEAMAVGTDDERDPYADYLMNLKNSYENPGFFQTYTFDHDKLSLVSFLDNPTEELEEGKIQGNDLLDQLGKDAQRGITGFMGSVSSMTQDEDLSAQLKKAEYVPYKVPETRALGRPHMLGWLELLEEEERFVGSDGKSAASSSDGESKDDTFEADEWKEVEAES